MIVSHTLMIVVGALYKQGMTYSTAAPAQWRKEVFSCAQKT